MTEEQQPEFRVRTPRPGQIIGTVTQMVGGSRMIVECADGKTRNCRIPGRSKRNVRIRERDVILIEPWSISGDSRGDVVWRYDRIHVDWLKRHGYIK